MGKDNNPFLLQTNRTNISYNELKNLIEDYHNLLEKNPVTINTTGNTFVEVIKLVKRENEGLIGTYRGLTLFEALNRIATDLVTLHGLEQLIEEKYEPEDSIITVSLGNENSNEGDFEINGKFGEVFNASPAFFKIKLRTTRKKWSGKNLHYILFNGERVDLETRQKIDDIQLIPVKNWDKR